MNFEDFEVRGDSAVITMKFTKRNTFGGYKWIKINELADYNITSDDIQLSNDTRQHKQARGRIHTQLHNLLFDKEIFRAEQFNTCMNNLTQGKFGNIDDYFVKYRNHVVLLEGYEQLQILTVARIWKNDGSCYVIADVLESMQDIDEGLTPCSFHLQIGVEVQDNIVCHLLN